MDVIFIPLLASPQKSYRAGDPQVDGTEPKSIGVDDNSIDSGTGFDVFDLLGHTELSHITGAARNNLDLLREALRAHGFVTSKPEWWHDMLADTPFPNTYFDFKRS